jgi:Transposase DDE domain
MHRRLDTTLQTLRQDLDTHLDEHAVDQACRQAGHRWRPCLLTPFALIHWLLIQVLHGNTAIEHITLLAGRTFTASAYCQARARLPLAVLRATLKALAGSLAPVTEAEGRWRGHRTFLLDGSSFSMPDTPELQRHFGQPGNQVAGCGFPTAKILALFHAGTGLLIEVVAAPLRTHDMAQVEAIHPALRGGDVVVGDRGLCSFAHLASLVARGAHAVFRVHQRQVVDFTPGRPHSARKARGAAVGQPRSRWVRSLGPLDQVVEWPRPAQRPGWMTEEGFGALPESITVRELRYTVGRPGYRTRSVTLVTTLLDAELYPAEALAELYGARWRVEQDLRDLKRAMGMDVLKCRSVDGVLKELTAYAIAYNLVRLVMGEAASRQGVQADRVSFVDALRWLLGARPGDDLPDLVVNPGRPGRFEPRVRKRRPKQFPLMKRPRAELRKALIKQALPS